ncbi:MAG: NAD-dependent dehydratase [Candidatus Syntrophoarchaeum caldarius]|uniref:UDP-glucuronate decarboxylase n=1 Tax=Candidatus Syntropharchaeum caldarium TaxID=1838285 RepID=A0A1F2P827_9EURY|nr:MAG: NAD-dependent dehydratase [Candidatus Syntrophoarchaeum caldarius]
MMVIVAGGAGFIGSHLCEYLLERGYEVICLDNFITGREKNIRGLLDDENFKFIEMDITEPLPEIDADWIFNLASPASPPDYMAHPITTMRTGSFGTYNLLELARKRDASILFASTSEVYGDPQVHPQREDYWGNVNPVGPRSVYDEAKRFSEALTMAYKRYYGLDTRIARIFNTYGPRMRENDGRAIPNFIAQALRGEPLTVYGDGSQTRSFCHISDMIRGLYLLMESRYSEPVNIGNPNELSILELAKLIIDLTGSDSRIEFEPLPVDDPKVRMPEITRIKEAVGWEPSVGLRDGLKDTIEYFRRVIG